MPKEYVSDFSAPCSEYVPPEGDLDAFLPDSRPKEDLDGVMLSLAAITAHYEKNRMDGLQCRTYRKALDWLQSLKDRVEDANRTLGAIRVIGYGSACCDSDGEPVPGTEMSHMMAYNRNTITDEDAEKILERGDPERDPRVVAASPEQMAALFPHILEQDAGTEKEEGCHA